MADYEVNSYSAGLIALIEKDADAITPTDDAPLIEAHTHEEVKSVVMTPRMDQSLVQKAWSWLTDGMKPGVRVIRKEGDESRYMVLITSNSYEDREKETITTKALEQYEASCYPGEGLYHNDNPLVYWHDRDIVMGDIIAVNLSGPFLIEVAKEAKTPVARVLWDIAEVSQSAGVSHEFGYLSKDRSDDGTYTRIFKQETTWLPHIDLAANGMTYAGVVGMASAASDKWLDETFERIAGVKNASAKLHAKTGELERELEAVGITHKAFPPVAAPAAKKPLPPRAAEAVGEAVTDEVVEEEMEDDAEGEPSGVANLEQAMVIMNQIMGLVMQLVDAQGEMATTGAMVKAMKELETQMSEQNTVEKAANDTIEQRLKAMQDQIDSLDQKMNQTPKSVQNEKGMTPQELETSTNALAQALKQVGKQEIKTHPVFGVPYDPSKIPTYDKE